MALTGEKRNDGSRVLIAHPLCCLVVIIEDDLQVELIEGQPDVPVIKPYSQSSPSTPPN